jgi:hypothetical protein
MINIFVNNSKAKAALDKAMTLEGALSSLLTLLIGQFQRQVKANLASQGREFGQWETASKWIIAKKGSSKLFEGVQERVRVRNAPGRAEVVFDSPGEWTLTQHQGGFFKLPTGNLVTLDLKAPLVLGVTNSKFSFISKRESRVPPRRMWPTDKGATQSAKPLVEQWAKALEARIAA